MSHVPPLMRRQNAAIKIFTKKVENYLQSPIQPLAEEAAFLEQELVKA
jgi:hypothetical protein